MKLLFATMAIILFSGVFAAAGTQNGKQVKVLVNKPKTVNGIKIKFIEVVDDSRCPTDTECIWAGNARIKLQLSKNGKRSRLVELNTGQGDTSAVYEGVKIELVDLNPKPATNIRINRNGYTATLAVSKAARR